jgi:hypothetical protein
MEIVFQSLFRWSSMRSLNLHSVSPQVRNPPSVFPHSKAKSYWPVPAGGGESTDFPTRKKYTSQATMPTSFAPSSIKDSILAGKQRTYPFAEAGGISTEK